jgi:hypothetical protein
MRRRKVQVWIVCFYSKIIAFYCFTALSVYVSMVSNSRLIDKRLIGNEFGRKRSIHNIGTVPAFTLGTLRKYLPTVEMPTIKQTNKQTNKQTLETRARTHTHTHTHTHTYIYIYIYIYIYDMYKASCQDGHLQKMLILIIYICIHTNI